MSFVLLPYKSDLVSIGSGGSLKNDEASSILAYIHILENSIIVVKTKNISPMIVFH